MSEPTEEELAQIPPEDMPVFPPDEYPAPQDPVDLGREPNTEGGDR